MAEVQQAHGMLRLQAPGAGGDACTQDLRQGGRNPSLGDGKITIFYGENHNF